MDNTAEEMRQTFYYGEKGSNPTKNIDFSKLEVKKIYQKNPEIF